MSAKLALAHPNSNQQGFVLVLTLWVLVIVAIAAGYFAERVARSIELAQQSRQNTSAMIDMEGTRADILYRLGTTSITEYGLGRGNTVMTLDNAPYYGLGKTIVRLQDNRGLLNLNAADDDRLQRFLELMGIPTERHSHLIDTLHDFIDADKLHRLNGAEDDEYRALNLPPPANQNLITPWEAKRIIGWRDFPQLWKNGRLSELTTTGFTLGFNPNTAPAEVLATLPGVTEDIAQIIIAKRKLSPIINSGQLAEITSIPIQQMYTFIDVIPSNAIRITQSAQGILWSIQYNITLMPNGENTPWRIDYYSRISTNQRVDLKNNISELPPRSSDISDKAPAFLFGG